MDRSGGGGDGGGGDGLAALSVKLSGRAVGTPGRAGGGAGRVGHRERVVGGRGGVGQDAVGRGSAAGEGGHQDQQANHDRGAAPARLGGRLIIWRLRGGGVIAGPVCRGPAPV